MAPSFETEYNTLAVNGSLKTHQQSHNQSQSDPTFRYTSTRKLQHAQNQVAHDFRSDVVTVPTEGMMQVSTNSPTASLCSSVATRLTPAFSSLQAIIDASVQDDMYNEEGDPSVNMLQDRLAEVTGKEAALWVVSGTMGNQICLRTHLTQPPHSVMLDHRAHVHNWETGSLAVLSQGTSMQVVPENGIHLTVDDVKRNIIRDGNSVFFSLLFSGLGC